MERLVQRDVRSAYIDVLRSKQQIEATRVTRELQERKLEAELEKFRVGKSTNFMVLQAQRDVTASHLDEARPQVFYLNALTNLYIVEGTLLDRRGIGTSFDQNSGVRMKMPARVDTSAATPASSRDDRPLPLPSLAFELPTVHRECVGANYNRDARSCNARH